MCLCSLSLFVDDVYVVVVIGNDDDDDVEKAVVEVIFPLGI